MNLQNTNYGDVIELYECGLRRANLLLKGGYRLFAIAVTNFESTRRETNGELNKTFIRHNLQYVFGRTSVNQPPIHEYVSQAEEAEKMADALLS